MFSPRLIFGLDKIASIAFNADPLQIEIVSPGKSYLVNNSRISSSTNSNNSESST